MMVVRLGGVKNNQPDEVTGDHDGRNRKDEVKNEKLRFSAGLVLLGEEIHTIYDLRFTIYDWRPFHAGAQAPQS